MTGFGVGRASVAGEELSVEVRSLNHKFCEVKARLPRELGVLEPSVVKAVKERVARGAVEVLVKRQSSAAASELPTVNLPLAQEYRRVLSGVAHALGLPDDLRVTDIAAQPGVLRMEERPANLEAASAALMQALEQALASLSEMRQVEGKAVEADLRAHLASVETTASEVAHLAPRAALEYQRRLAERVAELARGVPVEPQRLAQEVAFFAERTDIAEEMARLKSHIDQFRALLASREPAGRKMDFLVQEMHREVNTTGSKSQHLDISARVVALKAEIERIREQVQNVE